MIAKQHTGNCGISRALNIIGGKWTLLIIRDLLDEPRRFCELEASLDGISPRTLALRLKELERDGIITRDGATNPAHPVYGLTESGRHLNAIIAQLRAWGETFAPASSHSH